MRRVMVVAGFCVLAAIAVIAVVGLRGGAGAQASHVVTSRAGRASVVRVASVTRSRRGAARVPQVPWGSSCFVTASPAGARGADECGGQTCSELIATPRQAVGRGHELVLGSRCPPQAILRGERARPGLRAPRSTVR